MFIVFGEKLPVMPEKYLYCLPKELAKGHILLLLLLIPICVCVIYKSECSSHLQHQPRCSGAPLCDATMDKQKETDQ